jgi:hypothetical protein
MNFIISKILPQNEHDSGKIHQHTDYVYTGYIVRPYRSVVESVCKGVSNLLPKVLAEKITSVFVWAVIMPLAVVAIPMYVLEMGCVAVTTVFKKVGLVQLTDDEEKRLRFWARDTICALGGLLSRVCFNSQSISRRAEKIAGHCLKDRDCVRSPH